MYLKEEFVLSKNKILQHLKVIKKGKLNEYIVATINMKLVLLDLDKDGFDSISNTNI